MQPIRITPALSVMAQPMLDAFPSLAASGFTTIINNRPDGEENSQPGSAAEAEAARKAGLAYSHIPVTGPTITEADVRAFQAAMAASDGPVLAHCKSGTRSLTLYAIGEVLDGRMSADAVQSFGVAHGINLAGATAWLATHGVG